MATQVYKSAEVELQDGTVVLLKPLPIGLLRKFMAAWSAFENVENQDDVLNVYIKCCGISLTNSFKDNFDNTVDVDGELSPEYKEYLESVLDIETIYEILDVCGNIKLNDPKVLEAAEAMAEAAGKN